MMTSSALPVSEMRLVGPLATDVGVVGDIRAVRDSVEKSGWTHHGTIDGGTSPGSTVVPGSASNSDLMVSM